MTWFDDGGNKPPHDARPTQAEVEAKAAEMYGEGWKQPMEEAKEDADAIIAALLDEARAAIVGTR